MRKVFYFQVISLLLAGSMYAQSSARAVTTVARAYQSPDGAFSLNVPAGWKTRKEDGSNEVSFLLGDVSVSVSTVPTSTGETLDRWMAVSRSLLKQQCPAAEIQTEGKTTVASAPGVFFTMYCSGPHLPTTVRESAALLNGKLFTFNVTSPTLLLAASQTAIDSMAKSFQAGIDKQSEPAAGYQDPEHRFSLNSPAGWTLTQRGDNGHDGVLLTHENDWISITLTKDKRLEEELLAFARQTQRSYTDLQQGKRGRLDVNGHRALTDSFTGADTKGVSCFIGITDIEMGKGNSATILWSASQDDAAKVTEALQTLLQGLWF